MNQALDQLCVNTLRMLSIDAIEQANSGHPGMPLGAAPMAYVLWHRIMRHNPSNPTWSDRDRFVLSAGHGSALLYSLLHLSGYGLSLEELKKFRQWGSLTPGHPEYGLTPGIEATTGPLGQGFAMGVGMAMAERYLAQSFNRQEFLPVVNHFTYAIVSDGDLMEGITSEAASLAGHLCLGKLIYLYDDNRITIEGSTDLAFSEDVAARFESYQWQVLRVEDGEDLDAIEKAIRLGQKEEERPTLIVVRTHIGFGSPKADSSKSHGSPLGKEAMQETRHFFQWPDTPFHVPQKALNNFREIAVRGQDQESEWIAGFEAMQSRFPEEAQRFQQQTSGHIPEGWDTLLTALTFEKNLATRAASGLSLNAIAPHLPALIGGSADLAPSNNTWLSSVNEDRNIHFGIREHAMGAMCNGMALHGGLIPFCGTFLVFSDYMRGAMRLSTLMNTHIVYVLTHDSIAVGEDGPTHQPIEHIATLRAMPNMVVLRPAEGYETIASWRLAITLKQPVALILSRQGLPLLPSETALQGVKRGAYVVSECEGPPRLLILSSGSELHLALQAKEQLAEKGVKRVRVVSMPSWEIFLQQPKSYQEEILPFRTTARLAIEAGSSMGWHRWVGLEGTVIAIDHFGASAPGGRVLEEFGFSVDNVVTKALLLLEEKT